jgi:UDP-N-acetylmuramyl pentapeptide phosphotransferase/UDP-N-acetylglucosamine-1-phosphate transferase
MAGVPARAASLAVAYAVSRGACGVLRSTAPGGADSWTRTNAAGRTVDLYAGPSVAAGAAAAAALRSPAAALAVLAAGACGAYDDRAGDSTRGFRAHLAALRRGRVTSGFVKLAGIGGAALAAGALMKDRPLDRVLAGVVIAGAAHCVNLVDVRPGRAVLATMGLAAPGLLRGGGSGAVAAAPLGAAAAVAVDDLGERTMLGDAGAHALGAAVGAAVVAGNGRLGLALHALGVAAATAYGEWATSHPRE